jgi:hypothetical protein
MLNKKKEQPIPAILFTFERIRKACATDDKVF